MLKTGNLWEASRELARQCLDAVPVVSDMPTTPAFAIHASWWRRITLGQKVRRLWRLAYEDASPVRLSVAEFTRLAKICDEVKAALADGTLRFQDLTRNERQA